MNNIDLDKLTEDIITKQGLVYLLDDINQVREVIYQEEQEKLSAKTKNIADKKLRNILKEQEQQGNLKTRNQQEEFLDQLKEFLRNLPQINLTIAFHPSDTFLKEISQWLENEIGEKVIINLTVNPRITGGAVIEYEGQYLNSTLSKRIEEVTSHE